MENVNNSIANNSLYICNWKLHYIDIIYLFNHFFNSRLFPSSKSARYILNKIYDHWSDDTESPISYWIICKL